MCLQWIYTKSLIVMQLILKWLWRLFWTDVKKILIIEQNVAGSSFWNLAGTDGSGHCLSFLFGTILTRGFISGAVLGINIHSTQRALWAQLAVGYMSAWRPSVTPPPKLTQVRWQSFDVRKRFLLLALSHQFTSVQPLTQSVIKSERVLCVFRSEQFASSFTNSVRQKELRYIISHHCFSWAVDQLSSLMASELLNCTVGEKVLF